MKYFFFNFCREFSDISGPQIEDEVKPGKPNVKQWEKNQQTLTKFDARSSVNTNRAKS